MIVGVQFCGENGEPRGRTYHYLCDIPGIMAGDRVIAPTARGDNDAVISEISVPEGQVDSRIMPILKAITQRKEETSNVE